MALERLTEVRNWITESMLYKKKYILGVKITFTFMQLERVSQLHLGTHLNF